MGYHFKLIFAFAVLSFFLTFESMAWNETYENNARWLEPIKTGLIVESGWFSIKKTAYFDVTLNKKSVAIGDIIDVYSKNGNLLKTFEVKIIMKGPGGKDNKIPSCWISWKSGKRPSEYLSIIGCE